MATKQEQQFNEIQKKNLEAAMRLAQLSIENSQRIMELQVGTAKSLFDEALRNGIGQMPSYQCKLDEAQIAAIAAYLARATGAAK